jgi:zinc protease
VAIAIERSELDGVPIYRAEGHVPFQMGLLFRVGRADETLPVGGITHLVEHLVIPNVDPVDLDYNGTVSQIDTYIWATGRERSVREVIRRIAANCAEPPVERLEIEREILLAEAATRFRGNAHAIRALRFGTVGPGQPGYEEYGLRHLDDEHVLEWARRRFGKTNLAVCVTGKPPEDVSWLPVASGGPRVAPPAPLPIRGLDLPAYYSAGPDGELALSLVIERSVAVTTALAVFEHRARRRLRYELGVSYELNANYEVLTADTAHYAAHVDFLAPNAMRARNELLAICEQLAESGPTAQELESEVARWTWWAESPGELPGRLFYHAFAELMDTPVPVDEYESERSALTPTAVAEAFAEAMSSLLLIEPPGLDPPARLQPYPLTPTADVSGRAYSLKGVTLRRKQSRPWIVAGEDGIALNDEGPGTTVRFDECTALLRWPDGSRGLWSVDGFYLEFDPRHWRRGEELVDLVDNLVPSEVVVPMDARSEDRITETTRKIDDSLKRGWMNREELDALPTFLQTGEALIVVANASRRWRNGVLAVTDQRLLFLYFDEVRLALDYEDIEEVSTRKRIFETTLRVKSGSETHVFTDIRPEGREEELRAAIDGLLLSSR